MIEPEAVAQDLMGITDDQEGFGVQLLYRLFVATTAAALKAHMSTCFSSPLQAP